MKNLIELPHTLILLTIFTLSAFLLFTNCKKEEPEEINEEEVINRVTLSVTTSNNSTTEYTWNEGSTIPSISLAANASSLVRVSFYDASDASDIEDITEEVIEEADEHFVFYEIASANLVIASASTDVKDSNGVSTNLITDWITTDASSGQVRLFLIHEPNDKAATTRGAIGGASDVELSFPIIIQ